MSTLHTTFLRRLEMLNYLRGQHEPVSTEYIAQHLTNGGYLDGSLQMKSQLRVIQRDLKELLGEKDEDGEHANEFGLVMTKGLARSQWWSLDPYDNRLFDFEKMPAFMALAFSVSEKHLSQVLPSNTRTELKRLFHESEIKLAKSEQAASPVHYRKLKDSVEFYQRGQSLQTPDFNVANLDAIYRAILSGRRLQFSYRSGQKTKDYEVHPFGVAIMLPKLYLVAVKHEDMVKPGTKKSKQPKIDQKDFRSFLVHKMDMAFVMPQSNMVPDSFNMKEYLTQGHMDVLLDEKDSKIYQLELEIDTHEGSNLLADLMESPIGLDQQLIETKSGEYILSASVRRTVQLRNWLLALGDNSVVLAPKIIAEDVKKVLSAMLDRYANDA